MSHESPIKARRYIGLDIHKHYMVAYGVDQNQQQVMAFQRVEWADFEDWMERNLSLDDAVVLEMTTNTWEVHDLLYGKVQSITVVHPPHVALIVRARVMTDKKAARVLAQLHAAGLLVGIWVPPPDVRDLRMLVAQRWKMTQLGATAKTRLHNVLHRHHIVPPKTSQLFHPKHESFWLNLPLSPTEKLTVLSDWMTVQFAESQKALFDDEIARMAAQDERVPLLIQLPGVGKVIAVTLLAAIGDITRFPTAKKLVGYSGLGASVHNSGQTQRSGRITKTGRKDLRAAMVDAARNAVRCHPHWKAWYQERVPRMGRMKALVAVARKLLVVVWHVLTYGEADRLANPVKVARTLFGHAYDIKNHLPPDQHKLAYVRYHLDRLRIGQEMTHLPWGSKQFKMPPSTLPG